MKHITLRTGEEMIEQADASHIKKLLFLPQANPGKLSVTNQRICFTPTQGRLSSKFEYELNQVASFSVGMANTITLRTTAGDEHKITGMFNKRLIQALEKVHVARN